MSNKEHHNSKEAKKAPALSLKERRAAKAAKRQSKTIQQLFPVTTNHH